MHSFEKLLACFLTRVSQVHLSFLAMKSDAPLFQAGHTLAIKALFKSVLSSFLIFVGSILLHVLTDTLTILPQICFSLNVSTVT